MRVAKSPLVKMAEALEKRCAQYGITVEQYKTMVLLQRGLCAICQRPPKKRSLNIDHDHATNRVRGLLCFQCNYKILRHNVGPILLRAAAAYLERDFDGRKI